MPDTFRVPRPCPALREQFEAAEDVDVLVGPDAIHCQRRTR